MKTKLGIVLLFSVLSLMVICPSALAHNLWLNPGNYYPQVGTTVDIGIGWGHKYPANRIDQEMKEGRLEEILAMDPDGRMVDLTKVSADLYKLNIEKPGVYLVTARIKPGFFTVTPEGRKWGDKKSVANPIKCTNFHIEAKTVIIAGGDEKNLSRAAGQTLELIPLTNLHNLKNGDKLTVKVLFEGKPLPNMTVKATYAGFEAEDIAPHTPSQKGHKKDGKHFPVETVTDDQGQAVVQLDKAGYWIILLSHRSPHPDKETCDEYMYNVAFTFEVQVRP
jgi:uncharacterized GH25 family protein